MADQADDEATRRAGATSAGGAPEGEAQAVVRTELPRWSRSRKKKGKDEPQAEVVEDDAFQRTVKQSADAAVNRAPMVIGGIAVAVLAIAAVVWWVGASKEVAAKRTRTIQIAAAGETRARIGVDQLLGRGELPPVVAAYRTEAERDKAVDDAIAALEGSSDRTDQQYARLLKGAKAMRNADSEAALAEYEAYLKVASSSDPLRFLAVEGKTLAQEASGDLEGALATAEQLAGNTGDYYRDMALWHRGRILESMERADEALEVYRLYVEEYPLNKFSLAQEQIRLRLRDLDPELGERSAAGTETLNQAIEVPDAPP